MNPSNIKVTISSDRKAAGQAAAAHGAALMRKALKVRREICIILATGASQFEMLDHLLKEPGIPWECVTIFHLDEYVGLPVSHPASFRRYLWERFQRHLPVPVKAFHYVDGENDPRMECARLGALIRGHSVEVCFAGIGENAHLAFNDPPADFKIEDPYLVVQLDDDCRAQQLGEGWFPNLGAVPKQAISMSIHQILKSKSIIIAAPDERKAAAIQKTLDGLVTPNVPASILQTHPDTSLFLDPQSASLLTGKPA